MFPYYKEHMLDLKNDGSCFLRINDKVDGILDKDRILVLCETAAIQ